MTSKIVAELLSLARQSEDAAKANDAGAAEHRKEYEALCRSSAEHHDRILELREYVVMWPKNADRLRGEAATFRAAAALIMTERQARAAVDEIIDLNLTDRRGLSQAWAEIDLDVQDEIRETWTEIVMKHGRTA